MKKITSFFQQLSLKLIHNCTRGSAPSPSIYISLPTEPSNLKNAPKDPKIIAFESLGEGTIPPPPRRPHPGRSWGMEIIDYSLPYN